ncbi:substrate-binding periplasmic protein [Azospirillum rugosum]|uniref:Polar amino acid transport system substrate-binding protein n=1 Tax=Azospirillum rugosum TaxID=416170 RepID=A0ABS4SMC0_9PROT|nr:transporter substrate-binding domain-containing protein [Azospirillum rugosum]MBP2293713.1 polar amino acid transport system substrate-binding protein [Azospirillum rugosum]MDQ0527258.1 polar amino acid transport system substrate-binding protein [Azospirillum rugosum]
MPGLFKTTLLATTLVCAALPAAADQLRMVALSFPPLIHDDGGKPAGIAYDIVTRAMAKAGHTVTVEIMPWARALDTVRDGGADAIFTAYKTPEREQFLNYSTEVLVPQVVSLFVAKDSKVAFDGDLSKLAAYKVGVVNQISYGSVLDDAFKAGVLPAVEKSNDSDSNVKKLLSGRFDVMPSNRYVAQYFLKQEGALDRVKELSPPVQDLPSYIAFTKARDTTRLRNDFDAGVAAMKASGDYQALLDKYAR